MVPADVAQHKLSPRSCSRALAGRSAAPPVEPDNKGIVKLEAFPAAVSGGRPYKTRARIMYRVLDSMWGGRIACGISL